MGKIAASVLLKLFIIGKGICHRADPPECNVVTYVVAGVAFDSSECSDKKCAIKLVKKRGKVKELELELESKYARTH